MVLKPIKRIVIEFDRNDPLHSQHCTGVRACADILRISISESTSGSLIFPQMLLCDAPCCGKGGISR